MRRPIDGKNAPPRLIGACQIEYFRRGLNGDPLLPFADQYLRAVEGGRATGEIYDSLARRLSAAAEARLWFSDARLLRLKLQPSLQTDRQSSGDPASDEKDRRTRSRLLSEFRQNFGDLHELIQKRKRQTCGLLRRANAALVRLTPHVTAPLLPNQALDDWLIPSLAQRLAIAGVCTVGELISFVNTHGFRFDQEIQGLGAKAATDIRGWLLFNAEIGACKLDIAATMPSRKAASTLRSMRSFESDIVPFEHFLPPATVDGSNGYNRAARYLNRSGADCDYEAVKKWIGTIGNNTSTKRMYQKESERLILWATLERRKALSSLTSSDCVDYLKFIRDPSPAHRWVAPRHIQRWDPAWRPFSGPLSLSSARTATLVLKALCAWLVERGYLVCDPLAAPLSELLPEPDATRTPHLTRTQWWLLNRHAKQTTGGLRSQAIVSLTYWTALSVHEIADARLGDLHEYFCSSRSRVAHVLLVRGRKSSKGKPTCENVSDHLMSHLVEYMASRGFGYDVASWPPDAALIGKTSSNGQPSDALSTSALVAAIKTIFFQVADIAYCTHPNAAKRLRNASALSLRHTGRDSSGLTSQFLASSPVDDDSDDHVSELACQFDEVEQRVESMLAPLAYV